jgi:hypothetical protein
MPARGHEHDTSHARADVHEYIVLGDLETIQQARSTSHGVGR